MITTTFWLRFFLNSERVPPSRPEASAILRAHSSKWLIAQVLTLCWSSAYWRLPHQKTTCSTAYGLQSIRCRTRESHFLQWSRQYYYSNRPPCHNTVLHLAFRSQEVELTFRCWLSYSAMYSLWWHRICRWIAIFRVIPICPFSPSPVPGGSP